MPVITAHSINRAISSAPPAFSSSIKAVPHHLACRTPSRILMVSKALTMTSYTTKQASRAILRDSTELITVALVIRNNDSTPMQETSGELFIIVFIRDIGN
jgi:hypothetical protein